MSHDTQALVRVFVPTYRRHSLLPRALESLRAQTFKDWVCEVHNDDPTDNFPAEFVKRLGDPRIELHNHKRNLGALETFNLFYRPTPEPFYCLLEDDNWWESEFLDTMISAINRYPDVTMVWCNQKVWEELPDGSWRNTGRLVNLVEHSGPRLVEFGDIKQVMGALHANGAMLLRSRAHESYVTPPNLPFVAIEPFRERMVRHPLLYVPQPLAIFAETLQTARSESRADWAIVQTMLAATFVKHANYSNAKLSQLFADARAKQPPGTSILILAALMDPSCRNLLRYSKMRDWFLLLRGLIRRPNVIWQVSRSRRCHPDWWRFLEQHTALRFLERLPNYKSA